MLGVYCHIHDTKSLVHILSNKANEKNVQSNPDLRDLDLRDTDLLDTDLRDIDLRENPDLRDKGLLTKLFIT